MPRRKKTYKVTLKVNNKDFVAYGNSIADALHEINPGAFFTRGVLIAENDGKKIERVIFIRQLKRLFGFAKHPANPINQAILGKMLNSGL